MEVHMLSQFMKIQRSINELRQFQEQSEKSLQSFIQQELQKLNASLLLAHAEPKCAGSATSGCVQKDTASKTTDIHDIDCEIMPAEPTETVPYEKINKPTQVNDLTSQDRADFKIWEHLTTSIPFEHDAHRKLTMKKTEGSQRLWDRIFRHLGCATDFPTTRLAKLTQHHTFVSFQTVLILSNAAMMGFEVDAAIKAAVQDPPGQIPAWIGTCNMVYTVLFIVELLFRVVALRTWFCCSPDDRGWNIFDVCVVFFSAVSEIGQESGLTVLRTFRILRAVRAIRVIRVLRFFSELRQMFFAILACMSSLMWCFVFLAVIIFIFSVLILQGIADALNAMEPNSPGHARACHEASKWYGSLGHSMFSLLTIFTAGTDFYIFLKPISPAGALYVLAFVIYTLFVIIGVMNVLTGVFLANAEMFADRSLICHNEQCKQEAFVQHMTEVFQELDMDSNGTLTWAEFADALSDENMQAYLSAHGFQVTHAQLVFDILDEGNSGSVGLMEFVLGMLRLKGEAKALDARLIQRQIGMLPQLLRMT